DSEDWICSVCQLLDTPCVSALVTCDGPCLRSFHLACLDLREEDLGPEEMGWQCDDCERGEHMYVC
ncbi:unnamed protein product, partial [Discosporangium mesarthrocarpum]